MANLLFLLIAIAAFLGWRKGFIEQLGSVAALVLAFVAVFLFGGIATPWMAAKVSDTFATPLSYCAVYIGAYCVVRLLARLLHEIIHVAHLGIINSLAGALFGAFKWSVAISVVLNILYSTGIVADMPQSSSTQWLLDWAPRLWGIASDYLQQ